MQVSEYRDKASRHKLADSGDDPETDFGMIEGVGHGMSWGSTWRLVTIGKGTRKEGEWPTRKEKADGRANGQRKSPLGLPRGFGGGDWVYLPFPARALRTRRRVKSKHRAK